MKIDIFYYFLAYLSYEIWKYPVDYQLYLKIRAEKDSLVITLNHTQITATNFLIRPIHS